MDEVAEKIIEKYYPPDGFAYHILHTHVMNVTKLALKIAEHNQHLNPDMDYIRRACMLHDIGIFKTNAPEIGCYGDFPYIAHTFLGRELLEWEGLEDIAPICERHVGVGITLKDILKNKLPLPRRDMSPQTVEEKIICYADKFYSKNPEKLDRIKPLKKILKKLSRHGKRKVKIFKGFMETFGYEYIYE